MIVSANHCRLQQPQCQWTSMNGTIERSFVLRPKNEAMNYFAVRLREKKQLTKKTIDFEKFLAPRVDRHLPTTERYVHPSEEQTIHEQRTTTSDLPPLPMPLMDMTSIASDPFTSDALAFITSSIDTYPIYKYNKNH